MPNMLNHSHVSIIRTNCFRYQGPRYNFRPSVSYPEYLGDEIAPEENPIYHAVRESLHLLGLDKAHWETPSWNPLGEFIKPGMHVLIKPNLVLDTNREPSNGADCLYTQPDVVAPVIDYVLLALGGTGKIVIGDAPVQSCDFEKLVKTSGYDALISYYQKKGVDISIVDFRGVRRVDKHETSITRNGDDVAGTVVDLGTASEFYGMNTKDCRQMRITSYDPRILATHHNEKKHEYCISNHVLEADVIINMPKPKTHRKAGVTISLKNFIGTNVHKEFLPHHTMGSVGEGGDEYMRRSLVHTLKSRLDDRRNISEAEKRRGSAALYRYATYACSMLLHSCGNRYNEGSWYGNHTISRTIADVNKIIYYADKTGKMQNMPVRQILIIADMIITGEKEGPMCPSPKNTGIIAAGINPVCFDEAIAALMGMDIERIPTLQAVRRITGIYRLVQEIQAPCIMSNDSRLLGKRVTEFPAECRLNLIPSDGWRGHIEKRDESSPSI